MNRREDALGLVETRGLTAAIEAADAIAKAADVRLVAVEKTVAALMTVQVVGEVAAVQAAVDAGRRAAERVGEVVGAHVIPRPDADVRLMLALDRPTLSKQVNKDKSDKSASALPTQEELENMSVRSLRTLARSLTNFPIQGRTIAQTRKQALLEAFASYLASIQL